MPCSTCNRLYSILPCEARVINEKNIDRVENEWLVYMHNRLAIYCPCKECIVRMACRVQAHQCSELFYHLHTECKRV